MLFSIVIPVWNKRPHIERALKSVLNQSFHDFEIVAVDDCSTDGSIDELQTFSDHRIRIIPNPATAPSGAGGARNIGIRAARGEWISFLDADDAWEINYLEEMFKLIKLFPDSGILAGAHWFYENENNHYLSPYSAKYSRRGYHSLSLKEYLSASLNNLHPIWTSITTVKKTIFDRTGYFPEGIINCEDLDMWLRIMAETNLAWSPYPGATYFQNSVNKLTKFNGQNAFDLRPTIDMLLERNSSGPTTVLLKKYKNLCAVYLNIPKIKSGKNVTPDDFRGFHKEVNPWLTFEIFLLINLPNRVTLILLAVRRRSLKIIKYIQQQIQSDSSRSF